MSSNLSSVENLVRNFTAQESVLSSNASRYTETEVRNEFIDPFFAALGWDMLNSQGYPNNLKDVVREESQIIENRSKRPDYTLRIGSVRKLFIEAKKPAVDINTSLDSAFQVRSYGFTAGLSISVLTNFKSLRIYDTTIIPREGDNPDVALLREYHFTEYVSRYEEIRSLIGREAVGTGSIDAIVSHSHDTRISINDFFLSKINDWRVLLAEDILSRHPDLSSETLNDLSQKVINRLVFIRMCEDRGIEGEFRLRNVANRRNLVDLKRFFIEMDERYNTGLFDTSSDPLEIQYHIDSTLFLSIVEDLYYPNSPYTFSVLTADFLGQVYEHFLVYRLNKEPQITLIKKAAYEDREIVTTPQVIVDKIVRDSFELKISQLKSTGQFNYDSIKNLKIIDLAVGSGRFLIRAVEELFNVAIDCFLLNGSEEMIYRHSIGDIRLRFDAKRDLLESCFWGIDIDYNAVEICRFSLLVKLLEDETINTLPTGRKILPDLDKKIVWGNSIVDEDFIENNSVAQLPVHPLNWGTHLIPSRFDIILGNPPYVKTEEMKVKSPIEFSYYKQKYDSAYRQFDKYYLFIERALEKLNESGVIGFVVSNKWITIESGAKLRGILSSGSLIHSIIDFGNELLFHGKSTYVCTLSVSKTQKDTFNYRFVNHIEDWLVNLNDRGIRLDIDYLENTREAAWVLPSNQTEADIISAMMSSSQKLSQISDVDNGVQTSAETVFVIENYVVGDDTISFIKNGVNYTIEKSITRPYLMNSALIRSYHYIHSDALIVFPYKRTERGAMEPFSVDELNNNYPLAATYLNSFRDRLLDRKMNPPYDGEVFYKYGRHQALDTAFSPNKIIFSVNQRGEKYSIDRNGSGFASGGTAGEVSITNPKDGYSIEFIYAFLNTKAGEFFMRKRGSPFRGGYYSRGSAVVSDFPIPILDFNNPDDLHKHNELVERVQDLFNKHEALSILAGREREQLIHQIKVLRDLIESNCYEMWGISAEIINSLDMPGDASSH